MADIMNAAGLSGMAGGMGSPGLAPAQPAPTTTGTPLMNVVTYLLFIQCGLILLLTLPVYVPYRKEAMEFLHYSPSLWKFRVVLFSMTGFLGILTVDTYLRLDRLNYQIVGVQSAQANAIAGNQQGGMGGVPQGGVPPVSSAASLNDLFGSRFRAQRDFYLLAFNLFASLVLFQMHLLLMRLDRYKNQRNAARAKAEQGYRADVSANNVSKNEYHGIGKSIVDTAASVGSHISNAVSTATGNGPTLVSKSTPRETVIAQNASGNAPVAQRQTYVAEQ